MSLKKICICLILIFCIIGAASAAEDVSADVVDASDDAVAVDAVSEDVDDSVESTVVEDESVVDESAPAQEENDDVKLEASVDNEVLADEYPSSDDELLGIILDNLDWEDVTIHLSSGTWSLPDRIVTMTSETNIHIIGEDRDNTIFTSYGLTQQDGPVENTLGTITWENITFLNNVMSLDGVNYKFINCKFINYTLDLNTKDASSPYDDYFIYDYSFINCDFANYVQDVITGHKYANIVISGCTFDDITSDAIVFTTCIGTGTRYDDSWSKFTDQSSVSLKDCTFTNINVKGIVKATADAVNNVITENNYDFNTQDTLVDGDYTYIDVPVTAVDSVVDISSSEKGVVVITLTDGANPIAGATVKYTVNGAEEQTVTTGDDGKATISGLTGEVTIAVNYEGNESFNGISDSKFFNFTEEPVVPAKVATKITAPKVSAVYNVAKNLVITLTDNNGKVLANKKVTVKVGTISKTLTTNAKGQVSLNVATLVPKTYTATVKFAGDDAYLASTVSPKVVVSKAKPKITAKAKTFKVKVKTKKYTVTLKNNKGKVLKKVKLTLKVGKKTYKATTNSKGKATFKITKLTKKGKYTATVKFAGSKYYKALSKKVKITVKK